MCCDPSLPHMGYWLSPHVTYYCTWLHLWIIQHLSAISSFLSSQFCINSHSTLISQNEVKRIKIERKDNFYPPLTVSDYPIVSSKACIFSPSLIVGICTLIDPLVYCCIGLHYTCIIITMNTTLSWHNYMLTPLELQRLHLFVFFYISRFVLTNVYLGCKFARWIIITLKSS